MSGQNIEFFHIYTDEAIGNEHTASIPHLRRMQRQAPEASTIILVDNYNPKRHTLTIDEILHFLEQQAVAPDFYAYEADMVAAGRQLLASVTKPHLQRSYQKYIDTHSKLPCSLLAAAWYLVRLGVLKAPIYAAESAKDFVPAQKLVNILPEHYRGVERRAAELIVHSPYAVQLQNIENIFYSVPTVLTATVS